MSDLPYPFCATDEAPFYTVALGNGEYVWVVLAGDYRRAEAFAKRRFQIAVDLYADLHPHQTRRQCMAEVMRREDSMRAADGD